jgi:hypothetical protein
MQIPPEMNRYLGLEARIAIAKRGAILIVSHGLLIQPKGCEN